MPKYRVYGVVTGTRYIGEFEANSKEEAEEMAWDREDLYVSLCHECCHEIEEPEITELAIEEVQPREE